LAAARVYRCDRITGDNYATQFVVDAFASHGRSGNVRILDHKKMISDFANLERRVLTTGRERIDHPQSGSDDCGLS
jgi:hypothetical protein